MTEERIELIKTATADLQPADFTKSGQPNMTVLKALVPDITTEERDEIWPSAKQDKSAPEAPATFDKDGATSIITMRDGQPTTVWFRDGKEIGAE